MGFLGDLGKAFMGKPLNPPVGDDGDSTPANTSQAGNGILDEGGRKIIPDIDPHNVKSQRQGNNLIVKAWIKNNSDQLIRIDTTYLLKQKRTHNQALRPQESRELLLYQGEIPSNENEHNSQIAYRLQANGDVFMENYRINYDLESDGKRMVGDLIDDGPVRDI